jgi:matrixin
MFRGPSDRLQRWTNAPSLVVLTSVMNYTAGFGDQENFFATSDQLTDAETTLMIDQLTEALALLTGNTFTSFASVERESHSSGDKVNTLRLGKIVIGRYNNIQGMLNTIGFGRWAIGAGGDVVGGSIFLDRDYDETHESRRLLRTHELGHALGYNHVTARVSIMNPAIGPEPTTFDRQGAIIAFQRPPGNQSPDTDPVARTSTGLGAVVPSTAEWSPPIF